jgi:uncharacterized membrane protein
MKHSSSAVEIQAAPDRVWAVLCDVEHWPQWTLSVTSIRRIDHRPFAAGSRVHIRQPRLRPVEWEVTELADKDESRSFTWVTRSPSLHVAASHHIEATAPGSRVTLSLEFSGLLGPLVAWSPA